MAIVFQCREDGVGGVVRPSDHRKTFHCAHQRWWLPLLGLLLCCRLSLALSEYTSSNESNLLPLTRIEQIRNLTRKQAALKPEVYLHAVVTFYDPDYNNLFIQDATAGNWVDIGSDPRPDLKVGDWVEVRGVVQWTDFAPDVGAARFRILGRAPLPNAPRVSFRQLTSAANNSRRVQIEGVVFDATKQGEQLRLTLEVDSGTVNVWIPHLPGPIPTNLVDAKVRVKGVCGATFNKKNQLIGVRLNVPSLADVQVIEEGPQNPFAGPVQSISSLLRYTSKAEPGRVKVRGVVTLQQVGRGLFIQDGNDGLYVESKQRTRLKVGDNIEAAGFPGVSEGLSPILQHAILRSLGNRAEISPRPIPPLQALQGEHDSELVRIKGRLLHEAEFRGERVLTLEADSATFEADLRPLEARQGLKQPEIGSLLELTGVCSIQANENGEPLGFRIILRSANDISILRTPSWWTLQRALSILGLAFLAGLLSLVWVSVLRRRVRRQTEIIRLRLESEAALEKRLHYVIRATNDAIWDWDLVTQAISWSSAIQTTFRHASQEIGPGREWWFEHLHPEDRQRVESTRRAAIGGLATTWSEEFRFLRGDGTYAFVLDRGYIMRNDTGRPTRMIGAMMDISSRKQVENEMQRAKEAAETANRAKSEFLANMSHEIRTPMNGILGATELALSADLNPELREYLGMVKTSADSLLCIIDDILDFSKIEAGKLDLDPIPFRLRESLALTMKPLALRAHQKGLEFTCDVHPDVPEQLIADPTRLRQVIINLLGNAIKFTDRGEVGLEVGVDANEQDQLELHFRVHDSGIGIPAEKQNAIFEAFSQVDGSTTRRFGGTGLGLTISSRLVKLMGGRIWVESEPGRGSRFHFTAQARAARGTASLKAAQTADLAGLRALVVDDNATNRRILGEMLRRQGIVPTLAAGSTQATELVHQARESGQPLDLYIIDAHMPETDGFALIEQIGQYVSACNATIIMLTSGGQRGDAARVRKLGVAAYLTKPVAESELFDAILAALGAKAEKTGPHSLVTRHSLREGHQKLRILLAEDNAINQTLAARLIEKRGHAVTVVGSGREALEALEKSTFDAVLMDVQMPEMDGFEATAEIRKAEKTTGAHIPIIAMTAYAMRGDRERCMSAGMDGYVSKPIQPDELLRAIYAHMRLSESEKSFAPQSYESEPALPWKQS